MSPRNNGMNSGGPLIYSNLMTLRLDGATPSFSGNCWIAPGGDELENIPIRHNNLKVSRRVKVFTRTGVGRWLEIIENISASRIKLTASVGWSMPPSMPGAGDSPSISLPSTSRNLMAVASNASGSVLLIAGSGRSGNSPKSGPNVFNHSISLDPGQVAVVCTFLAIGEHENLASLATAFDPRDYLKDLPPGVCEWIVNFQDQYNFCRTCKIVRSDQADVARTRGGQEILGTIANKEFQLDSPLLGKLTISASSVVAVAIANSSLGATTQPATAAASPGSGGDSAILAKVLLSDGQVIHGHLRTGILQMSRQDQAGQQEISMADLEYFSYKVSPQRPAQQADVPWMVSLADGQRLVYSPTSSKLGLRSLHGLMELDLGNIKAVELQNKGAAHAVLFGNGSRLSGILEPADFEFASPLTSSKVRLGLSNIIGFDGQRKDGNQALLSSLTLRNGDHLEGELISPVLSIAMPFAVSASGRATAAPLRIPVNSIRSLTFDQGDQIVIETWNKSTIRSKILDEELAFQVLPGPVIKIRPENCRSLLRQQPLSPLEARRQVQKLVAQLAAEGAADRQQAAEQLIQMGKSIVPLLQKELANDDLEIRQQLGAIIKTIVSPAKDTQDDSYSSEDD